MINFLHTFNPEPILISIGPINIYWYGLFVILGIITGLLITLKISSYYDLNKNTILDLAFWLILGGIVGARVYHIFLELSYYLNNPLGIFKIWQGGLAIHGAIIAGVLIIWFYAKKNKINFWLLASVIVPSVALAQAIGRWGNYFNQELFGLPTNLPWGIPIDFLNRSAEHVSSQYFHPTFLYESIGSLCIFIALILIHILIIKKSKENNAMRHTLCVICYAILYSILRFSLEFIRIDKTPITLGLRWPQIISLLIIIISAFTLLKNKKNYVNIQNSSHTN